MVEKNILKRLYQKYFTKKLVKVYSHPRSGTHFLEAFLAENFYKGKDLSLDSGTWGHWSNRKVRDIGNPYGKLFKNHHFPKKIKYIQPKIYIVRDGRSVAYSIWNTPNFINKELRDISFHDFLRTKIDWKGSPSNKVLPEYTILEHWYQHVKAWEKYNNFDNELLIIKYEELLNNPYEIYLKIHDKFFKNKRVLKEEEIDNIKTPVGLLPNKATINSWEKAFSEEDKILYFDVLSKGLDSYKNL